MEALDAKSVKAGFEILQLQAAQIGSLRCRRHVTYLLIYL